MQILREPKGLRAWSDGHISRGKRIALVPTMGYLHEGHLSLVRLARQKADVVAASIFVNPTQFGPKEDLSRYPRDLQGDLAKLEGAGVDGVFTPEPADMYPPGFDTYVVPTELATVLCGASRPGHFKGVCTVVHLLFRMSRCHVGVFGAKDYQQLTIIRRMARDLWLDVEVVGGPIMREADGLALSSRNVYLSADERTDALVLSRALGEVEKAHAAGERDAARLVTRAREVIAAATSARIDYVEVADAETLKPVSRIERPVVCAMAVFVGKTRLIDNRVLGG
jgi:pantoate--beta-alanine ligase